MNKKYIDRLLDEEHGVCQDIVKRFKGTSEKAGINQKAATAITAGGLETSLPEKLWMPLVRRIVHKAAYSEIKSGILTMDDDIARHLAGK